MDSQASPLFLYRGAEIGVPLTRRHATAVICHLHYPDLLDELVSALEPLAGDFDLYISIPREAIDLIPGIFTKFPDAHVLLMENIGRDIKPFIVILKTILPLGYENLLKIHTKRSPHRADGEAWRQDMYARLLGNRANVLKIQERLAKDPGVGIIAPKGHVVSYRAYCGASRDRVLEIANAAGVAYAEEHDFPFVAGTMFWAKPKALTALAHIPGEQLAYEDEVIAPDGALVHALERFIGLAVHKADMEILETNGHGEISEADLSQAYPYTPPSKQLKLADIHKAIFFSSYDERFAIEHLRITGPYNQAGIEVIEGMVNGEARYDLIPGTDAVVIQREFPRNLPVYEQIHQVANEHYIPIIYDLDDLLFNLPGSHPEHQAMNYTNALMPMLSALMQADLVTVSTNKLRETLIDFNENIHVLTNYLDDNLWQVDSNRKVNTNNERVIIGYMGSSSHKPDLETIAPVLVELLAKYGERLRLQIWGTELPEILRENPQVSWIPSPTNNYREFAAYFQQQKVDILIAPLDDNLFNRCKSGLKFLEYSALGVPGVYSKLDGYAEMVTHGQDGFLADSAEEWKECLVQLIEEPVLRVQMGTKAHQTVMENWLLSKNLSSWQDIFKVEEPGFNNQRRAKMASSNMIHAIAGQLFWMQTAKDELVRELNRRNEALESAMETIKIALAKEHSALEDARELLAKEHEGLVVVNEALAKLDARYQAKQKEYQSLLEKSRSQAEQIEALKTHVDTVQSNIHLLEEKQDQLETTNNELRGQLQEKEAERERLARLVDEKVRQNQGLKEELSAKVSELDGIKASRSWKVALFLKKVRSKVAPVDGKLARTTQKSSSSLFKPISKLWQQISLKHDLSIIKKSPLFDKEWYLVTYPDVLMDGADPAKHYMFFGAFEGRDPSKGFNSARYLRSYPDVKLSGINPLVHYLKFGKNEGRKLYVSESQDSESVKTQIEPETQVTQNVISPIKRPLNNQNETYSKDNSTRDTTAPLQQLIMGSDSQKNPYATSYLEIAKRHGSGKNNEYVEYQYIGKQLDDPAVKMIAFYLPQFHPIPENDEWWGKGFTEWANVTRATPQYLGHYQPRLAGELGYYDLRVPEAQKRQIELAKNYGIYGFCFHYYWFNGRRLLEKPLEMFINDKNNDFHFCVCWANENWTRKWDGRSRDILIAQEHSFEYDKQIIQDFIKLFRDPRYIRIDGRPLLIVYRADILQDPNATLNYWRRTSLENGMGLPFILAAQTFGYDDPIADGFDGAVEFPPHNGEELQEINGSLTILNPDYKGIVYKYDDFASASIRRIIPKPFRRFNTVFPGWDNEARQPGGGYIFDGATPDMYGKWLNAAGQFAVDHFSKDERIVFINAWNEWAEGAYLEPDRRFGYAYLQKTSDINHLTASYSKAKFHGEILIEGTTKDVYEQRAQYIKKQWPEYNLAKRYDHDILVTGLSQSIDELLCPHVVGENIKPIASIIIPVFNHFEETLNCLKSIGMADIKIPFEVIIIDDNSSDETQEILDKCQTLNYIRNLNNLGFLRSCNHAAQFARGEYIVLLNNDTIVLPNWLETLVETFKNNPGTGLVGSKLVYPDGRLQEAGGLMWHDASGINFGRDDDPFRPQYNYLREVDYCSAASICVPLAVWKEVDGFDELFSPAYYEDTDLAFRLRDRGYKVMYQPLSQVIHLEGVTSGTDVSKGVKRYQDVNREKFFDRWKNALSTHGDSDQNAIIYRNRTRKKRVLVIDVCTPKPDQDSGSVDTFNYLLVLRNIGFEVTFISVVDAHKIDRYVSDLQGKGIECITQPYLRSIEQFLEENGKFYDLTFLFRAPFGGKYIDLVRKHAPDAKVVFNTVDLHFLRERREREIAEDTSRKTFSQEGITEDEELGIMRKADQTIVVSEYELGLLKKIDPTIKATVIGLPREIPGRSHGYEGRKDIVFIGGFLHKPNVDAVQYFTKEIWPLVQKELPQCKFLVVGSNVPPEIQELASASIKIVGFVPNLNSVFSTCRLTVAPLRFGAGIKGKVITSLSYGVPCVATSVATEGMGMTNRETVMVSDDPKEFAGLVAEVYKNNNLWEELSNNGLCFVYDKFSISNFETRLKNIIVAIDKCLLGNQEKLN